MSTDVETTEVLSLRDEFAKAALSGLLAATPAEVLCNPKLMADKACKLCETAYAHADAMVAESKKSTEE